MLPNQTRDLLTEPTGPASPRLVGSLVPGTLCSWLVCLLSAVASQDECTLALKKDFLPQSSLTLILVVASEVSIHASV